MALQAVFVQEGLSIDHTPGSAVTAGDVVVQGELVAVAIRDIAANELGALVVSGVLDFTKKAGLVVTVGLQLFWDDTANEATDLAAAGANKLIGKAVAAALSGDATTRIRMNQ